MAAESPMLMGSKREKEGPVSTSQTLDRSSSCPGGMLNRALQSLSFR
jgi:hypothetical protein